MAKSRNVSKSIAGKKKKGRQESFGSRKPLEQEQIAQRAYTIWQEQGCPVGREEENWYQAERELKGIGGS
jgi:hypothetical protein